MAEGGRACRAAPVPAGARRRLRSAVPVGAGSAPGPEQGDKVDVGGLGARQVHVGLDVVQVRNHQGRRAAAVAGGEGIDDVPVLVVAGDPGAPDIMTRPPRDPKVPIANGAAVSRWIVYGAVRFFAAFACLAWGPDAASTDAPSASRALEKKARTK